MSSFSDLFAEEYNTQRDQWEKALKHELKLDDITGKLSKKHLDLGAWPTLSLETAPVPLQSQTSWKKASQTYFHSASSWSQQLGEDLEAGVRVFFFSFQLKNEEWKTIEKILIDHVEHKDIEVIAPFNQLSGQVKVVDQTSMLHARDIHDQGGHNIQELALLTLRLIENLANPPAYLGVCLDSHFFKNIAKVRALKLLAQKVAEESGRSTSFKIITLNSYREWTLYERYSNMLRNNVQVASGFISGADIVQSSGYQALFDMETDEHSDHNERSLRMARNTTHILSLESMLGMVEDAAYGSFHLETLSQEYAKNAWSLMQELLIKPAADRKAFLENELSKVREQRLEKVKTRKDILAGMNDFPDARERLNIKLKNPAVFRVARGFEELRLKVEGLQDPPRVQILLKGDYAALNNRINFIKNYFEVIGLEVLDPMVKIKLDKKILVLCAKDEDYAALADEADKSGAIASFVAGKVEIANFQSIFAGQNIYQVLSELTKKLGV